MRRIARLAFIICIALAFYASVAQAPFGVGAIKPYDKVAHMGLYCVLAVLGVLGWPSWRPFFILALPLLGLGAEVAQISAPGREFEWMDVLANAAGVGAAVALTAAVTRDAAR